MSLQEIFFSLLVSAMLLMAGCTLEPPHHASSTQPTSTHSRHNAVAIAQQMVGKPYRFGGSTPQGFDCSGLVYYSYSKAGYRIARDSDGQYAETVPVDPRELRPGDLLFFKIDNKNDHVGIYVGGNRFIHAPSGGKRVSYASLDEEYWRRHFQRAGRVR